MIRLRLLRRVVLLLSSNRPDLESMDVCADGNFAISEAATVLVSLNLKDHGTS